MHVCNAVSVVRVSVLIKLFRLAFYVRPYEGIEFCTDVLAAIVIFVVAPSQTNGSIMYVWMAHENECWLSV